MSWSRSSRKDESTFRGNALARTAGPITLVDTLVVAVLMRSLSLRMIGSLETTEARVSAKFCVLGDGVVPFETIRPLVDAP